MNNKNTSKKVDYLRIRNFTITQSLNDKLPLFAPEIQERMAFIQSFVIYAAKKAKHPAMYVNISATTFQKKYHDYKSAMTLLVSLGELDVNESYRVGRNAKSYRIPAAKLASGTTTFSAKIKRIRAIKDKSIVTTRSIAHQQKCFKDLRVRHVFISTGDKIKDEIARRELLNVRFGAANIRKGSKVNREFNTVLAIPRDARINLAHKDAIPLCEFDFKSCHPFLLINYCEGQEREDYAKLMTNQDIDIYDYVAAQTGSKLVRDDVKEQSLKYINGGKSKMFEEFYAKHFPRLNCFIKSGGKCNAKMLQDFESSIMEELGEWCADNGKFYVQQHDGYLSTPADGKIIARRLADIVESRIGARPVVKSKELSNPENITYRITNTTNNTDTIKDKISVQKVSAGESNVSIKEFSIQPISTSSSHWESNVSIKELPCAEIVQYQDTYSMEDELEASLSLF